MSEINSLKGRAARFTSFVAFSIFFSKLVGIVSLKIFTNILTQDQYGLYNFFINTTTFLSGLALLGIPNGVLRYMVKYDVAKDIKRYRDTAFTGTIVILFAQTLLIVIVFLLAFFNITFFESKYYIIIMVLSAFFLYFLLVKTIVSDIVRAKQFAITYFIMTGLQPLFILAFGLIFIIGLNNKDLGLIYGYVCMQLVYAILFLVKFSPIFLHGRFSKEELTNVLKYGLPGIPSAFMINIYAYSLPWLLQTYYAFSDVAIYNVGLTVSNIAGFFTIIISTVFGSIVFRYYEHELHDKLSNFLNKTLKVFLAIFVCLTCLIYGLASRIIILLSNKDYIASRIIILPLLVILMIQISRSYTTQGIWLKNKTTVGSITFIIAAAFSIFVGLVLVPMYGVIGVVVTQIIYELSVIVLQYPFAQYYYSNHFNKRQFLSLILLIILTYTSLYYLETLLRSAFFASIIVSSTFIVICLILKVVPKEDYIYSYNLALEFLPENLKARILRKTQKN